MEMLDDATRKEMISREGDTMYFSDGVDPDYCVLKFDAESGRYNTNFYSESFGVGGDE
ncbi:hypothetical protein [Murimonas intestini]|uniref:hypothetical protein n=1 Tax=Murimonas intestini TaxID=1337051 RepID=UPI002ED3C35C